MTTYSEKIYAQMVEQKRKALELGKFCLSHGITKADLFKILDERNDKYLKKEEEEKD